MKHVLIVDDSPVIRKYARLIFESLNFRVSEAETGKEALDRVKADCPDYVLIDWIIPGVVSHDLIASMRRAVLERRPYIIYLVTENDIPDVTRAFKSGADDYLLKPFNREIVEMKLREIQVAA